MIRLLTFLCISLFVFGCQSDKNTPEEVTRNFVTLMGNGENDKAKLFGTKSTERFLAFRTETMDLLGEDPIQPVDIQELRCMVEGKTANCAFCCDQNGNKTTIPLVLRDGKWLVDIQIDDLIEDFEKSMMEMDSTTNEE